MDRRIRKKCEFVTPVSDRFVTQPRLIRFSSSFKKEKIELLPLASLKVLQQAIS